MILSSHDFPEELLNHPNGKVVQMNPTTANKQQGSNDAIFLLQEGASFSCADLARGFSEWKIDPVRVVGFFSDGESNSPSQYSLLSDRAMFVHRLYLSTPPVLSFQSPIIQEECQHLALSAYLAALSSHSPLLISTTSVNKSNMLKREEIRPASSMECVPILLRATGIEAIPTVPTSFIGQSQ
jgi:hypothetical protein